MATKDPAKSGNADPLLDGTSGERPSHPKVTPQSHGAPAAAYQAAHDVQPQRPMPAQEPSVIVQRPRQPPTLRIDRSKLPPIVLPPEPTERVVRPRPGE